MTIALERYKLIRNNLCLSYTGRCDEYIIQLKLLRHLIEKQFPELKIFISCRDEISHLLKREDNVILESELQSKRRNFGYIKKIKYVIGMPHPIDHLFSLSGISVEPVTLNAESKNSLCSIISKSEFPTKEISKSYIEELRTKAMFDGYHVEVNPDESAIKESGWVISVENRYLFEMAANGVKTTLINSGIGGNLYKKMFPNGNILKNK